MGLLNQLLGSGQQRQDAQEFVQRYETGGPSEGYSGEEVLNRYQQIAPQLPPEQYHQAAQEAFSRMPPEDRAQFGQYVQQQAAQQGYQLPPQMQGYGPQQYQDPNTLAQMTTQLHQQQPGLLGQIFQGRGEQNVLGNPFAKAALAGVAAIALKNMMGGGGGSPLGGQGGNIL